MKPIQFDPDFACASDYAKLYRQVGLQAVPSHSPLDSPKNWKRPLLSTWKEFESTPVPDSQFDKWFGWEGSHKTRTNIGLITGACSGGAFILDVDSHKNPEAQEWLMNLLDSYNEGNRLSCPTQQTGGGGFQYLLRAPAGWTPPTIKTPIGIDIRGQGGFAVMPPSVHDSGSEYKWIKGSEPWNIEIPEAEGWLTAEIDLLAQKYGAGGNRDNIYGENATNSVVTPTPQYAKTDFGQIIDGREEYMTKVVFAKVLSLYRDSPILPSAERLQDAMREAFGSYERNVKSRIQEAGTPNHILLEREGRGHSLFAQKWSYAIKQWDDKVAREAAMPRTRGDGAQTPAGEFVDEWTAQNDIYEILNEGQIMALPDPVFLIDKMVIENSLGFIYGAPASGKSFIALGMGMTLATGQTKWWGKDVNGSGAVIMISSEGTADMKNRLAAWRRALHVDAPSQFHLIRQTINFMDAGDRDKLHRTVSTIVDKIGSNPIMVIVDTLSRAMAGTDENDQAAASMMVQACDGIREIWKTTVLCVHHTSRMGNMRGSTVFEGAADFIYGVEKEQGAQSGTITAKKIKAAEDGWVMGFNLRKISVGEITENKESLFAEPAIMQIVAPDQWPDRPVINAMLNGLQQAWDDGNPLSSKPQTRREGRYAIQHMVRYGINEDIAEKVLNSWLDAQIVVYETANSSTKMKGLRVKNPYGSSRNSNTGE
jgi:hypothetical protein